MRLLCLHQAVEGATCGPGEFTFRAGPDVIRRADLPRDVAAVLCGHVHRHQVLAAPGAPLVVYAGSTERTSRAEAGEAKGAVVLELGRGGVSWLELRPLPDRPLPPRAGWRRPRPHLAAPVAPPRTLLPGAPVGYDDPP